MGESRYRSVLVIEDDEDVLFLVAELLRVQGCTVHTAREGAVAMTRLGEVGVDLILLDLTLPDMSGSEFLEVRARVPALSAIPVVILSGSDDACAFGERSRLPVLRKPFGAKELMAAISLPRGDDQDAPARPPRNAR